MDFRLIGLAIIVSAANMIGSAIGFGSSVITLTLAAHLFDLHWLIPVVVPLNMTVCGYMTVRHFDEIDRRMLLRRILPLVLVGLPIGFIIFRVAQTDNLRSAFGVFVAFLALFEMTRILRNKSDSIRPMTSWSSAIWLLMGGIVQGLWVSGGPLIGYWAGRNIETKGTFRATLFALWLILNTILLFSHIASGNLTLQSAKYSLEMIPFLAVGVFAGERLHHRLPEKSFRIVVYFVLFFAGASIIVR